MRRGQRADRASEPSAEYVGLLGYVLLLRHPYDRLLIPNGDEEIIEDEAIVRQVKNLDRLLDEFARDQLISPPKLNHFRTLLATAEADALNLNPTRRVITRTYSGIQRTAFQFPDAASVLIGLAMFAGLSYLMPFLFQRTVTQVIVATMWASLFTSYVYLTRKKLWNFRPGYTWLLAAAPFMAYILLRRLIPIEWAEHFVQKPFYEVSPYLLSVLGCLVVMRFGKLSAGDAGTSPSSARSTFSEFLALPPILSDSPNPNHTEQAMRSPRLGIAICGMIALGAWALSASDYISQVDKDAATKATAAKDLKEKLRQSEIEFDNLKSEHGKLQREFVRLRDGDPVDPAGR